MADAILEGRNQSIQEIIEMSKSDDEIMSGKDQSADA
jgi:hypothetical protein